MRLSLAMTQKNIVTFREKNKALKQQKDLLTKKRNRLNNLIELCNLNMKGNHDMSFKQFDMTEIEQYKAQAKEQFGNTKEYAQSLEKTKNIDEQSDGTAKFISLKIH